MSENYNTLLNVVKETEFQKWKSALPANLQSEDDYDLRGAFLESAGYTSNLHMTDKFKKPNHMTFSEGSQYSNERTPGGKWVDDGKGGYVFFASPVNVQNHSVGALQAYFSSFEKGNTLVAPSDYRLPRGGRQ